MENPMIYYNFSKQAVAGFKEYNLIPWASKEQATSLKNLFRDNVRCATNITEEDKLQIKGYVDAYEDFADGYVHFVKYPLSSAADLRENGTIN